MTDWSKALEVFGSGILGVYLVMILLQVLTQVSTRIIDVVENRLKEGGKEKEPVPQAVAVKE